MRVSPIAPALWLASVIALAAQLVNYMLGFDSMDPLITIIFYLLATEASKFVAEITMENDDG